MPRPRLTLAERFWQHVDKTGDCWTWTGATDRHGYGSFWMQDAGGGVIASRVSFSLHFGEIPDGLLVCHHCDNPRCVRPDHLFLGTGSDNAKDAVRKGRVVPPRARPVGPVCLHGHERETAGPCTTCRRLVNDATAARRKAERLAKRELVSN